MNLEERGCDDRKWLSFVSSGWDSILTALNLHVLLTLVGQLTTDVNTCDIVTPSSLGSFPQDVKRIAKRQTKLQVS
jgi:hypothetical protein